MYSSEIKLGGAAEACFRGRNWYPWSEKPEIACGEVLYLAITDNRSVPLCSHEPEMDWDIKLQLNSAFSYLNTEYNGKIRAEVTPDESLFEDTWFQDEGAIIEDKNICVCGPYVRDEAHDDENDSGENIRRLEIHPSQLIWWTEVDSSTGSKNIHLFALQDDSRRFSELNDFNFPGGIGDNIPAGFQPWVKSPLKATFKIAFLIYPPYSAFAKQSFKPMKVTLLTHKRRLPEIDNQTRSDADNGSQHKLVLDGNELIIVDEHNIDDEVGIQFTDIKKRSNGLIQGYIEVSVAVGRADLPDDEKGGYYFLIADVVESKNPQVPPPGTLAVGEKCAMEKKTLQDKKDHLVFLNKSLKALQKRYLRAKLPDKPQLEKLIAELKAQIQELKSSIEQAERELKICNGVRTRNT